MVSHQYQNQLPSDYTKLLTSVQMVQLHETTTFQNDDADCKISSLCLLGSEIVTGDSKGNITIWSSGFSPSIVKSIVGHMHLIDSMSVIDAKEKIIATGSQGDCPSIRVWNLNESVCLATLKGHTKSITHIIPLGNLLVSCSHDGSIKIWDWMAKQIVSHIDAHGYPVLSMIKSQDGKILVSGGDDCMIKVWQVQSAQLVTQQLCTGGYVQSLCWLLDDTFASGISNGYILIWNCKKMSQVVRKLGGHTQPVVGLVYFKLLNRVVSVAQDRKMVVWDNFSQKSVCEVKKAHKNVVNWMALDPETNHLLTVGKQGSVKTWRFV